MLYLGLLLSLFMLVKGEDGCKDFTYLECQPNKTFQGQVIKASRVIAPGLPACQTKCFVEDKCVSYNLGPVVGQVRTCELNAADHWSRPKYLVSKEGFQYCPIKNHCSSNPCPAGRLCTPDFAWDTYSCDDGAWSQWSSWSCLTEGCPKVRERKCSDPAPQKSGAICAGKALDAGTEICSVGEAVLPNIIGCESALGMESLKIEDSQITSSTISTPGTQPYHARLNIRQAPLLTAGNWSPVIGNPGEWLMVDLLDTTKITKVATQGSPSKPLWITEYSLSYSKDNITWYDYDKHCIKNFPGNSDQDSVKTNTLEVPIIARYLRLNVVKYDGVLPGVRMELYGCSIITGP